MSNIIAVVGRPNVGKSTFFNRMINRREAIVDSTSGVTRDRHYSKCDWNGKSFTLIDTGGYIENSDDVFQKEIDKQVNIAIDEADAIIFMVDVNDGLTGMDLNISKRVRKSKKSIFLVVNKVDNSNKLKITGEFYELGFDPIYPLSSINGSGTGELLDDIVLSLNNDKSENEADIPKFAVVGRPNAGKSSYINCLIGEERNIVTEKAGTTRDSIYSRYNLFGFDFNLVDTAGIRRKSKVKENVEFYSVIRSIRSIEYSDVCLLIVDVTRGFDGQVQNIFWLAHRNHKGIVILINKWDLIDKKKTTIKDFEKIIKEQISPFEDVPIIFISSLNKQRVFKSIEKAVEVYNNRKKRISTKELNNYLLPIIEKFPPPSSKGKYIKIKFCNQLPTFHPQFVFFCNLPQYLKDPYKRFLENKLREKYDFNGTPIQIFFRKK
jgi:GTP-binding protein